MIQTHITDLYNIAYDEYLFYMDDCPYGYDYKLNVNNNYDGDICECVFYLSIRTKGILEK